MEIKWVEVWGVVKSVSNKGPKPYISTYSLHLDDLEALDSARDVMRDVFPKIGKDVGGIFKTIDPSQPHVSKEYIYKYENQIYRVQIVRMWMPYSLWNLLAKRILYSGGVISEQKN